jgi:catechol 2,3-dioxygenase-like lactoylglutathione lyase family enzyme
LLVSSADQLGYTIIAPVSRLLGSTDLPRTTAFYRDVLGFKVETSRDDGGTAEVVQGRAHIRFGAKDYPPGDWDRPRAAGAAVVFFETNDVEGFHAAIRARGGTPSELENVNGIKMRVFEIRDPDGHTLWFGQSLDEADQPRPPGLLEKIIPEFPLSDVPAGVVYYRDILGFQVNYEQSDLAVMDRDGIRLLLVGRTERHKGIGSAYVYVHDADSLHVELSERGANVQGEPVSRPWGLREFRVLDVEANQITFGQPFE